MRWKKNGEKFWMLDFSESFVKPKICYIFASVKTYEVYC